jgi:hypothetical protein
MRCENVSKVAGSQCSKPAGHIGAHIIATKNYHWTDDDIIWDYELNNYRAVR